MLVKFIAALKNNFYYYIRNILQLNDYIYLYDLLNYYIALHLYHFLHLINQKSKRLYFTGEKPKMIFKSPTPLFEIHNI